MKHMTLALAAGLIDDTLAEARRLELAPLCVAVVDAGGHLVALKREDDAAFLRPRVAAAKATGAVGMGLGGAELARRSAMAPGSFASLVAATGGAMVAAPGGVLIRDDAGRVLGAVGVSGDASDKDEACAVAAIVAAGLTADTGARAA